MMLKDDLTGYGLGGGAVLPAASLRDAEVADLVAATFWRVTWPRIRDRRIRIRKLGLRWSVRVRALRPLFEVLLGPGPADPVVEMIPADDAVLA